jgi:diacylglycerol kinase family enzyme
MRRVAFFSNPLLVERGKRRSIVDRCAGILRSDGCIVEMHDTLSAYSAGEQARDAVESGFDTIFACGGDGTFFQVLQGVAGSEAALGLIPFGTGNVLARNLRLPRDPVAAFELQRKAEAVSIPLGEVKCRAAGHESDRSWYFTIAAGLGVHAALMDFSPNGSSKRALGRAAYYSGGVRLLMRHPVQPFDVEMNLPDGGERRFRACELLSVRVPEINLWRPGGDLCSSQLRIAAVSPTSRLGLSHAMFHALFTRKSSREGDDGRGWPYPRYENALQVVCRPVKGFGYETPLLVEADGEVVGVDHATFRMARERLRLLWPRGARS